ncbi:MAG: phenylalanine--tRNA ligase subunit beta [Spirochaetaceae bacterium]|nr:MAG: phenylalanine--tRNA ligase subunit beta [Spirochaetaceae bacterium]
MPKIELYRNALDTYIGERLQNDVLEEQLSVAKAEVDEWEDEHGLLKIELNDTNRPDLWSTAGLGRQLRVYRGGAISEYDFFSTTDAPKECGSRVVQVDAGLKDIRPYIAGFVARGPSIDESTLNDIIQTQEKLCWNYGQKRRAVAMGIYRSDLMQFPVSYRAADPDATQFIPLAEERAMSLRQMITEHPKGRDFGHIVADFPKMPYLEDAGGDALSFPPVINSARLGAVEVGDSSLFIELTGTDQSVLHLACSIVACDLADAGFTIEPVCIEYPYDTPAGTTVVTPQYFQTPVEIEPAFASKWLGVSLTAGDCVRLLGRMGCIAAETGGSVRVQPPPYRNDFLHPVDIAEDIMIGYGMGNFEPTMLQDFTVGRLTAVEVLSRDVKTVLVGLGFQEMVFNYLGSRRDYLDRMQPVATDESDAYDSAMVRIQNPMSENYEYVRPSVLPSLLSAEAVSAHAVYPHLIFEVGKVAVRDAADSSGTRTDDVLGLVLSDVESTFNTVRDKVNTMLYFLNIDARYEAADDSRFIAGRCAKIRVAGRIAGIMGELHPQVLENWGISMPTTAAELNIGSLLSRESGV